MGQELKPPLTPAVFFTLFGLAGGDKHGYAIMQEARSLSDGSFQMGPATLYTTLQRLLDFGLIQEVPSSGVEDARRRVYTLTRPGRELLEGELARIESMLRKARPLRARLGHVKP